jgi:hypothetical protein
MKTKLLFSILIVVFSITTQAQVSNLDADSTNKVIYFSKDGKVWTNYSNQSPFVAGYYTTNPVESEVTEFAKSIVLTDAYVAQLIVSIVLLVFFSNLLTFSITSSRRKQ